MALSDCVSLVMILTVGQLWGHLSTQAWALQPMSTVMVVGQQHNPGWGCDLDSSLQQIALGWYSCLCALISVVLALEPYPGSYSSLGSARVGVWAFFLFLPCSLCFCALCGPGRSRQVVGTAQLPAWASSGMLVVSGSSGQFRWDVDGGHATPTTLSLVSSILGAREGLSKFIASLSFSFPSINGSVQRTLGLSLEPGACFALFKVDLPSLPLPSLWQLRWSSPSIGGKGCGWGHRPSNNTFCLMIGSS